MPSQQGERTADVHIMPLYYKRFTFFRTFALPIVKANSHSFASFAFFFTQFGS